MDVFFIVFTQASLLLIYHQDLLREVPRKPEIFFLFDHKFYWLRANTVVFVPRLALSWCHSSAVRKMPFLRSIISKIRKRLRSVEVAFTWMNLQNLELFRFPVVSAFAKDSKMGFEAKIFFAINKSDAVVSHKYSMMCFAVSVLPEPVIPPMMIDCETLSFIPYNASWAAKLFIFSGKIQIMKTADQS